MPLYVWISERGERLEVRRSIDDFDIPPTEDECWAASVTGIEWTRLIQGGQLVTGLGNKGNH